MGSVGRGLTSPLLTINFLLCLVGAALAGWALNRNLDSTRNGGQGAVGKWNLPSLIKPAFHFLIGSLARLLCVQRAWSSITSVQYLEGG
jgi:hypothetical protein